MSEYDNGMAIELKIKANTDAYGLLSDDKHTKAEKLEYIDAQLSLLRLLRDKYSSEYKFTERIKIKAAIVVLEKLRIEAVKLIP